MNEADGRGGCDHRDDNCGLAIREWTVEVVSALGGRLIRGSGD